jgi:hypothetical protein
MLSRQYRTWGAESLDYSFIEALQMSAFNLKKGACSKEPRKRLHGRTRVNQSAALPLNLIELVRTDGGMSHRFRVQVSLAGDLDACCREVIIG